LFVDQLHQRSIFRFQLQQTNGSSPFLFSVFRKQTEVAIFHFPVPFSVCGIPETWRLGQAWKHGEMETLKMGMEEWRQQAKNGSPPGRLKKNLFTICSTCKQKFVVCPFVDEETN
jgi:hypothetical protein